MDAIAKKTKNMTIFASKKNREDIIFKLDGMTEDEAIKYARNWMQKNVRNSLNKRMYGWTFKIK